MAHYDRDAALDYSRRFWNVVCEDLCVAVGHAPWYRTVPAGTVFINDGGSEHALLPDGSKISWDELDDCTHYISCCVGKGGGLNVPRSFPNMYGQVSATRMVEWLLKSGNAVIKKKRARIDGSTDVDASIEAGDLIGYYDAKRGRYGHLVLYVGNGKIACHTYCRSDAPGCTWDNGWQLGGDGWTVDLLHLE